MRPSHSPHMRHWVALGVAVGLFLVLALASRSVVDAGFGSSDGGGDLGSGAAPPMQVDAATPTRPAVRVTAGPPPGGQPLPPTIPPVGQPARPGNQTLPPTIPPAGPIGQPTSALPPLPGAYPAQPGAPATTAPRPPAAATPLPVATSATAAATASPRPTGTGATPTTAVAPGAPAFLTLSGRIAERDGATFVVAIPGRGTVAVSPGPDTEVRRDNAPSSAASLAVGDNVTLVLGDGNQLLRILVNPETPVEPETANPAWTVFWQALLGLVMMGVVLVIDSELRDKFVGALVEPSRSYRQGKGPGNGSSGKT